MEKNKLLRKGLARLLSVLMILSTVGAGLTALGFGPMEAYAASISDMMAGNTLILKGSNGNETWEDEFVILDPSKTNTGADGTFVVLKNPSDKTKFNSDNSNAWEGSDAQTYCTDYYGNMPYSIRSKVIGVKTSETESGNTRLGINDIDGTGLGGKDKVFFLSFSEYDSHKDLSGVVVPNTDWLLRSPSTMSGRVGIIQTSGGLNFAYSAGDEAGARPAFNIDLTSFDCVSYSDETSTWTVFSDSHKYDAQAEYVWAEDNTTCTASVSCSQCDKVLTETVNATSSTEGNVTTYTATFEDPAFKTQTKDVETEVSKPESVIIERDEESYPEGANIEFQPASGGKYVWIAMDGSYYDTLGDKVSADDFKLQIKTGDSDWTDANVGTISVESIEEDFYVRLTATIPDNDDTFDKYWRVAYKHSEVNTQYASCESVQIIQVAKTDKSALETAIQDAQDAQTDVKVSEDGADVDPSEKYVTAAEKEALDNAITAAQAVVDDNIVSQTNIDKAVTALNAAIETYEGAKKAGKKQPEPAEKPDIVVTIESANEQPAAGGRYSWAFFGADGDIDPTDISAEDFSMEVKVGDSEWTTASDVAVTLKESEEYDGIVEAAVPDNTEEVAKQWRFKYAGAVLDWSYEETDCPAITQAAKETAPAIDKSALETAIETANAVTIVATSEDGRDIEPSEKYTTTAEKSAFTDAIAAAQEVYENTDATQTEVDAAVTALNAAKETYESAKKDGQKGTAPAEKPTLVVAADMENVSADGGEISWGIWDYEGNDLEGAVTGDDFTVMVDVGNGPEAAEGVSAAFVVGNTDDEGTVSVTAPANSEQVEKKWSLSYDGEIYAQNGEAFVKTPEWPYITQAAKPAVEPAVEEAAGKINELPSAADVTLEDKAAIEEARAAYEALTDDQKESFDADVLSKLTAAEAKIKELEDAAAADKVKAMINDLPAADKVTTADKEKIDKAKSAYDALTPDQKALIDADTMDKLTGVEKAYDEAKKAEDKKAADEKSAAEKAAAEKAAAAKAAAAEAKAKKVKTVTVNVATVNAKAIDKVVKKKGGSSKYVTKIVLGKKVKKISPKAFAKYKKVTTLEVKTKKLTKKSVKNSLKGSKVKTIKVKVAKKVKTNKKYVKKYKKIFTKKNAGKKVKVKR